jgi:O-acetyl-ADP-ribose deacetylase (regulator of RNase III)
MIRVVLSEPAGIEAEAVLRSVSSNLEADTPFSRELEVGAGPEISGRLQRMGDLPVGAAVITPAGGLSASFLIHVVLHSAEEAVTPDGVRTGLRNGLRRVEEWALVSVALPPLGTGAGNMEADEAASVMVPLILEFLEDAENLREVTIIVATPYERDVFDRAVDWNQKQKAARLN